MQTKQLCVLVHIRIKGEFGSMKKTRLSPTIICLLTMTRRCFFCRFFLLFVCIFVMLPCLSLAALGSPFRKRLASGLN